MFLLLSLVRSFIIRFDFDSKKDTKKMKMMPNPIKNLSIINNYNFNLELNNLPNSIKVISLKRNYHNELKNLSKSIEIIKIK